MVQSSFRSHDSLIVLKGKVDRSGSRQVFQDCVEKVGKVMAGHGLYATSWVLQQSRGCSLPLSLISPAVCQHNECKITISRVMQNLLSAAHARKFSEFDLWSWINLYLPKGRGTSFNLWNWFIYLTISSNGLLSNMILSSTGSTMKQIEYMASLNSPPRPYLVTVELCSCQSFLKRCRSQNLSCFNTL